MAKYFEGWDAKYFLGGIAKYSLGKVPNVFGIIGIIYA